MSQISRACPAPIDPSATPAPVAGSGAGTVCPDGPVRSSSFSAAVTRQPASAGEMFSTCRNRAAVDTAPRSVASRRSSTSATSRNAAADNRRAAVSTSRCRSSSSASPHRHNAAPASPSTAAVRQPTASHTGSSPGPEPLTMHRR